MLIGSGYIVLDACLDKAQPDSQGLPGGKTLTSCCANLSVDTVLACLLLAKCLPDCVYRTLQHCTQQHLVFAPERIIYNVMLSSAGH
jgi:hypothetical protein